MNVRLNAAPLLAMLVCAALAGCAHKIEVAQTGRLAPGAFAFLPSEAGPGADDRHRLEALVGTKLVQAGFKTASLDTADYVVEVGSSLTPKRMGVFIAAPADAATGDTWTVKPAKGDLVQVDLVVTERATGKPVFQSSAARRGPAAKADAIQALLIAALPTAP